MVAIATRMCLFSKGTWELCRCPECESYLEEKQKSQGKKWQKSRAGYLSGQEADVHRAILSLIINVIFKPRIVDLASFKNEI